MQGSEKGNLAEPERQHVEEAARRIDAVSIRDMLRDRGRAGKQSSRRKRLHRKIQPEKRQRGDSQQPARAEQERQDDQAGERIFGENVAVPDQAKVNEPEHQQHGEPAHEQRRAALAVRKPLELDGKACAEQQRKQRKRLQLDGQRQDRFDGIIERRCRGLAGKKLLKDRNAKFHDDVDGENAEQGDAPQHVDGVDPLGGAYRPWKCAAIGSHCEHDFQSSAGEFRGRSTTAAYPAAAGPRS